MQQEVCGIEGCRRAIVQRCVVCQTRTCYPVHGKRVVWYGELVTMCRSCCRLLDVQRLPDTLVQRFLQG